MSAEQQANLARATAAKGLGVSIESGGAVCGAGSGALHGARALQALAPFLAAGGRFEFFALESMFSRTHAGCKQQSQNTTATEIAEFAAKISVGLTGNQPKFFLYDALPHVSLIPRRHLAVRKRLCLFDPDSHNDCVWQCCMSNR